MEAPSLTGIETPAPELDWVELDVATLDGVPFIHCDMDIRVARQFIILNRARSGFTVESIVCNVAGENQFKVDDAFWSLANSATGTDSSRFFIGFRNVDYQKSDAGLNVETLTRGLWSVAVTE